MADNLSPDEREINISQSDADRSTFEVFTDSPFWIRRMAKLGIEPIKPVGFGFKYQLSADQVLIRKGKRQVSEAQREAMRKNANFGGKKPSGTRVFETEVPEDEQPEVQAQPASADAAHRGVEAMKARKAEAKALREWLKLRRSIIHRDKRKCQMCGKKSDLEVHHIKPKENGGGDNPENLITLCRACHDIAELEKLPTATIIRNWQPA